MGLPQIFLPMVFYNAFCLCLDQGETLLAAAVAANQEWDFLGHKEKAKQGR